MCIRDRCSFGIRNPDQTLVNATLEELGLSPYREQHPNTLSGGQKQRVAVAAVSYTHLTERTGIPAAPEQQQLKPADPQGA